MPLRAQVRNPMLGEPLLYYMLTHCLCLQADVCRAVPFKQLSFSLCRQHSNLSQGKILLFPIPEMGFYSFSVWGNKGFQQ